MFLERKRNRGFLQSQKDLAVNEAIKNPTASNKKKAEVLMSIWKAANPKGMVADPLTFTIDRTREVLFTESVNSNSREHEMLEAQTVMWLLCTPVRSKKLGVPDLELFQSWTYDFARSDATHEESILLKSGGNTDLLIPLVQYYYTDARGNMLKYISFTHFRKTVKNDLEEMRKLDDGHELRYDLRETDYPGLIFGLW